MQGNQVLVVIICIVATVAIFSMLFGQRGQTFTSAASQEVTATSTLAGQATMSYSMRMQQKSFTLFGINVIYNPSKLKPFNSGAQ